MLPPPKDVSWTLSFYLLTHPPGYRDDRRCRAWVCLPDGVEHLACSGRPGGFPDEDGVAAAGAGAGLSNSLSSMLALFTSTMLFNTFSVTSLQMEEEEEKKKKEKKKKKKAN
ncbi:hypothetical protein EYF80_052853 [Liparis tanakae]|uniref:Uncharacterized protein n=1 Tax=Liparis tanakae TaxID=230148 RepID=A0A4Z2F9I1_9TELE|nr:hypothetical protein EYF80_052853 [Liparis tanakae]